MFTSRHAALRRDCLYPPARPSALVSHALVIKPRRWRDFGLPDTARALYSGPQPACARRLPPVRPRKPRAWPHIFTIRLLYIDRLFLISYISIWFDFFTFIVFIYRELLCGCNTQ